MFERYTEKARRTIFFARYEASQYGSPYIEVVHLLLGLVREHYSTIRVLSEADKSVIREAIETLCTSAGQPLATSVDLPLSQSAQQVLVFGAEEAESMGHKHIGPEHLLLGVLRLQGPEASVLGRFGIALDTAREAFRTVAADPARPQGAGGAPVDTRTSITRLLVEQVPPDRLQAALRILKALASEYFAASGVSSDGPFSYSFGEVPPAA